jgi:16S rRNA C967 or C1407 C5-methylase (RsmB/RsmF family)
MLPPLYLDIKSTDMILDMCAAPGSKTSEMLEMLYG